MSGHVASSARLTGGSWCVAMRRMGLEPLVLASQAVVHFGAAVSIGQSMYQVDRYVDVNTRGTALLLDILVNAKHKVEKVIVALTDPESALFVCS